MLSRRLSCFVVFLVLSACSYAPRDRAEIPTKDTSVHFQGLAPQAGEVSFLALNFATAQFEIFAATITNGTTYTDSKGNLWYEYDTNLVLPQSEKYWGIGSGAHRSEY